MNKNQSYELLSRIEIDSRVGPASTRQIGNLEWIVILKARTWHCWSDSDYVKYLELVGKKAEHKASRKKLLMPV